MKYFYKTIAGILSALVILISSVPAVGAAETKACPQIKVINCNGKSCDDVKGLLEKLCNNQIICLNDILKAYKGYCPNGDCVADLPDLPSNQPSENPAEPIITPTEPIIVPVEPAENPAETITAPNEPAQQPAENPQSSEFNTAYEAEVLRLVNAERAKYGLSPLSTDSGAVKVAHLRAKEIVQSFSHTRPNGSSCFTVAKEFGVTYRTAGENIAYGYATPEQVVNGWMNSEGHRKNILSASFSKIGIGCYKSGRTLYWSQFFIG